MTAGDRAGIITDAGFIGGDRQANNIQLWRKTESNWSLTAWLWKVLGGVDMSAGVFPSSEAVQ